MFNFFLIIIVIICDIDHNFQNHLTVGYVIHCNITFYDAVHNIPQQKSYYIVMYLIPIRIYACEVNFTDARVQHFNSRNDTFLLITI